MLNRLSVKHGQEQTSQEGELTLHSYEMCVLKTNKYIAINYFDRMKSDICNYYTKYPQPIFLKKISKHLLTQMFL